jgi:hypothetical protein
MPSSGWVIASGRLIRHQDGAPRFDEPLPAAKDDIEETTALRDKIKAYGKRHGLSEGRISAGFKTLTEAGYYVRGPQPPLSQLVWKLDRAGLPKEQQRELIELLKTQKK